MIWPPSCTGGSQRLRRSIQVRCPGCRAFHQRSKPIPSGEATWQKRSQLVADLADRLQYHACQGDAEPIWTPPGSHLSTALVGEIAVWRGANGINPQDRRPTGGTQLEMLPALWKQRLDRDIARATYPPADARADKPHARPTALSPRDDRQRPYQQPERRPSGPSAPRRQQDIAGQGALPNPALPDQGPGSARPAGACPPSGRGRAAVWVSAPRGSGGRRLLN